MKQKTKTVFYFILISLIVCIVLSDDNRESTDDKEMDNLIFGLSLKKRKHKDGFYNTFYIEHKLNNKTNEVKVDSCGGPMQDLIAPYRSILTYSQETKTIYFVYTIVRSNLLYLVQKKLDGIPNHAPARESIPIKSLLPKKTIAWRVKPIGVFKDNEGVHVYIEYETAEETYRCLLLKKNNSKWHLAEIKKTMSDD